ncbi:ABC 3 transport family protein [Candidatus Methanoperedenaceae archaeon GB50]|nr:ABC 3 transport family protein [Candidatus Methanoperedenaceae archaeon GB50]CAD7779543.1 MAG: ABC 3 transport family protein [Candidatus Methanoperedenaceae archaeon GB50]
MMELLHYEFMRNALIAAILVSIACGIVGTYVVIKRIVSISGGISHAAFGGVGLGYLLAVNPILTAIPFTILSALAIGIISKRTRGGEDSAIGIIWAGGMALGILFIDLRRGYTPPDLFSYLFGSILAVPTTDLVVMLALDAAIIATVALFEREFTAISFDEEFSTIIGVPTRRLYLLLLTLIALSVVVLIRVVGIILVIALLTIPATISIQYTDHIRRVIFFSTLTGIITTIIGLYLSYIFDLASGASIVIVLITALIVSTLLKPNPRATTRTILRL